MRRRYLDLARESRRRPTPAETRIWHWLRNRYARYKFRRQHPLHDYILDFYCAELRLCIEVDGGVHDTNERVNRDAQRTDCLEQKGITVLRLRNEHIDEQPDGAWSLIRDAIEARAVREPLTASERAR